MSFIFIEILTIGSFLLIVAIIHNLLKLSKKQGKFLQSLALAHFIFIVILTIIYFTGEKDAQHQLFWMLPAIVDWPISLIYPAIAMGNMYILAVMFATLGTIQYAIIGWIIDLFLHKYRKTIFSKKQYLISFIVVIICSILWYSNYPFTRLFESDKLTIEKKEFYGLSNKAKLYLKYKKYKKSKLCAKKLLNLAKKYPENWNYGNAIYDGHIILGRIALLDDDTEKAKEHLFLAAKTPGSPTLYSFGPDMDLAKELLDKGHKKSVIEFLNQCKKFWDDSRQLDKWIAEIKAERKPDFSTNLEIE